MAEWRRKTDGELDAEIEEARQRAREADRVEPRARSARYDPESGRIEVELKAGCLFAFRPEASRWLEGATPEQLAAVEVDPGGEGLHWEEIDMDISLPGLIARLLNMRSWAAKYLGSLTSDAKARAARENGLKGGRPPKRKTG